MRYYTRLIALIIIQITFAHAQSVAALESDAVPGQLVVETLPGTASTLQGIESEVALGGGFSLLSINSIADTSADAQALCSTLVKAHKVASCSPNYILQALALPDDPKVPGLYGMSLIDAPRAWSVDTGSDDVVLAVVDTGVDYTHPDLAANIWTNSDEVLNGIDDDGNGVIDDIHGFSALSTAGDPMDENGHGTHVAGTIGGVGNNGRGVAGVNWNVKIMPLRFLDARGSGTLAAAIQALDYMVKMKQRGVHIVAANNSWGGGSFSEPLRRAIERTKDAGILFIAAAGNEANDNDEHPSYPASYDVDNIVSVAAVDRNSRLASFSNFGAESVHIAAPGVDIESTYLGGGYRILSGTSMATPHVTGAVGLLASWKPQLTWQELKEQMLLAGADVTDLQSTVATGRLLNVGRMLHEEFAPLPDGLQASGCSFSVEPLAFSPPTLSEDAQIVVRGDELSYYTFELPFAFPFYGTTVTSATISPNGILYLGREPSGMDFLVSESAPKGSIAALHTDLVSEGIAQGVRLQSENDRVVIDWKMRPFGVVSGYVDVSLVLYPTGDYEEFLHFSTAEVEATVQAKSLVGARGQFKSEVDTYAYSSQAIADTTSLRFQRQCVADDPSAARVDAIQLRQPKAVSKADHSESAQINATFWGVGTGEVSYRFMVNQRLCSEVGSLTLDNGRGDLTVRLRTSPKRFRSFGIVSGKASAKLGFNRAQRTRSWVRASPFSRLCRTAVRTARIKP